jgi:hypothetical protein
MVSDRRGVVIIPSMCASWRRGSDPGPLIRRLEDLKSVERPSGGLTFRGYRLPHVAAALQSSLDFDVSMPEAEERGVLRDAIRTVGEAGRLTPPAALLRAITEGEERLQESHRQRPREDRPRREGRRRSPLKPGPLRRTSRPGGRPRSPSRSADR